MIAIDVTFDSAAAVLFDAVAIPDHASFETLAANGLVLEFVKEQFRHCKALLAVGAAEQLLAAAGIPPALPSREPDPGVVRTSGGKQSAAGLTAFIAAVARHKHYERETDPPLV